MNMVISVGLVIIFTAGFLQGLTSFGFSLLAVPLLSFILPIKIIVPISIIYSLIMNAIILYQIREHVNLKKIYLLIISAVIATPIGANILLNVSEEKLQIIIGVIVTVSAIFFHFGYRVQLKKEQIALIPIGIISGLLNGSVSLSGPPVILFLTNQGLGKQAFRATLTAYFWILNIMTLFTFLYKRLITVEVLKLIGFLLPALVLGVMLGIALGNRVKEDHFKRITIGLILIMGILSIISGIS